MKTRLLNAFLALGILACALVTTNAFWHGLTAQTNFYPTLDPFATYKASGSRVTTTGTITNGTKTLVVASASGWSVGMGLALASAGSSGTTELITSVTNIVGTTFTINHFASCAAGSCAAGLVVNHDDTAAILAVEAAITRTLQRVHPPAGDYNLTSEIPLTVPQIFECDGGVDNIAQPGGIQSTTGGTVFWNRGKTNNILNISTGYITVRNCAFEQDPNITPTAGYGIVLGSNSVHVRQQIIENNLIYGTYGGISVTGNVVPAYINGNFFISLGGLSNAECSVRINNTQPAGAIKWVANEFRTLTAGRVGCIVNSDTNQWTANIFTAGDPLLLINASAGHINTQSFVNNSFESGVNASPLIQIVAGGNGVDSISFVGGELGLDGGFGGISITGAVTNVSITAVEFYNITGTPYPTSGNNITALGNIPGGTTPASAMVNVINGVAAVTCASGAFTAATAVVTNGILTHC